jgi:hypothetical protein
LFATSEPVWQAKQPPVSVVPHVTGPLWQPEVKAHVEPVVSIFTSLYVNPVPLTWYVPFTWFAAVVIVIPVVVVRLWHVWHVTEECAGWLFRRLPEVA